MVFLVILVERAGYKSEEQTILFHGEDLDKAMEVYQLFFTEMEEKKEKYGVCIDQVILHYFPTPEQCEEWMQTDMYNLFEEPANDNSKNQSKRPH
jgi:hypothetical protein